MSWTCPKVATIERIVIHSFRKAKLVSDRFHVQQLAIDAVKQLGIGHRWPSMASH